MLWILFSVIFIGYFSYTAYQNHKETEYFNKKIKTLQSLSDSLKKKKINRIKGSLAININSLENDENKPNQQAIVSKDI